MVKTQAAQDLFHSQRVSYDGEEMLRQKAPQHDKKIHVTLMERSYATEESRVAGREGLRAHDMLFRKPV